MSSPPLVDNGPRLSPRELRFLRLLKTPQESNDFTARPVKNEPTNFYDDMPALADASDDESDNEDSDNDVPDLVCEHGQVSKGGQVVASASEECVACTHALSYYVSMDANFALRARRGAAVTQERKHSRDLQIANRQDGDLQLGERYAANMDKVLLDVLRTTGWSGEQVLVSYDIACCGPSHMCTLRSKL
ncbi:hypothetical protein C8R47DRAFT_1209582 [Mycena vitilis]|nr:hypothetical protein C8R47DRAFT_1209582 [Mycena vitilis]